MADRYAPVELKTKATKQFQADLKKYAGYTGVPDYGIYTGYITCDMAIVGLQNAGNPPTRAAFAPNLRKLGPTTRRASRAARSTSAPRPTARLPPPAAAGTCRSRTASSCSSRRTGSRGRQAHRGVDGHDHHDAAPPGNRPRIHPVVDGAPHESNAHRGPPLPAGPDGVVPIVVAHEHGVAVLDRNSRTLADFHDAATAAPCSSGRWLTIVLRSAG